MHDHHAVLESDTNVARVTPDRRPVETPGSDVPAGLMTLIATFKQCALDLDRGRASARRNAVDDEGRLQECFALLSSILNGSGPSGASVQFVQRELLPYILLGRASERAYTKPRGYGGDYGTIDLIYRREPRGAGRLGAAIDAMFLAMPAADAVRNRRRLVSGQIRETLKAFPHRAVQVMSIGSGPAQEVLDLFEDADARERLRVTLLDIDAEALAHVRSCIDREHFRVAIALLEENVVRLALRRRAVDLAPQDLVYSIGLMDYLSDGLVVRVLDLVYSWLAPGGRALVGNFHPRNPNRGVLDHLFGWPLIHRSEADMDRLFMRSAFAQPCTRIVFEPEGINLFAECIK